MSVRWNGVALVLATPVVAALGVIAWGGFVPAPEIWAHVRAYLLPDAWRGTLMLALGVGSLATLLGASLAWLTATCEFPGRRWLEWALVLPLALPTYVLGFAALGMLDFAGPVQAALRAWFGAEFALPPIRSLGGLIAVMSLALYPYVYLVARAAFLGQGRRLLEAARSLGLGPRTAFLRVGLPLAAPALAAAALLVVMETVADFGTVAVFNQPSLTLAIYRAWYGLFALDAALRIATLLALVMLTLAWAAQHLRRAALDARGGPVRRLELGRWAGWLAAAYAALVFGLAFALPLAQLLLWAAPHLARPDGAAFAAAARTLGLAGGAALLTVLLAGLAALAAHRTRGAFSRAAGAVIALGYALPGPVLAVALFVILTGLSAWLAPGAATLIGGTLGALLFGYYVRFAAVAQAPIAAGLAAAPPALEQAARGLGSRGLALYWRLHLPLLRGAWLTALALVFVDVAKEMPMTLMLRPYGWDTLAVRIFEFTAEGDWARAAVPALGLVALGLVPVALLTRGAARS